RMVLDMHGEALLPRHQARAARHRPALEDAIHLQAEVVMQPPGVVLLDDEALARLAARAATRFLRRLEVALLPIGLEPGHGSAGLAAGCRLGFRLRLAARGRALRGRRLAARFR